jgi:hypothetical protein
VRLGTCRHCGGALLQGAIGCLGCGRLVDEHEGPEPTALPTQLGTRAKDALLDSRWRLIQPLGRGKMATTWLAHDVPFDRRVVVKMLDETAASDAALVERFEENARRLARVDHKNVIAVLALGRHQGVPFVAMRQADGRSLAEHLHARGGRLAPNEAAQVVAQLAEAFEAVHTAGGPQGSLQPRSIFVAETELRVTLLDVGAAPEPASDVTEPTTRLSDRLEWVAPEVLAGAAPSVSSDVFTLGCLAWELVCGGPPPRPVPAPKLLGELRDAIARATREDPAQRFATARELHEAIAALFQMPQQPEAIIVPPPEAVAAPVVSVGDAPTPRAAELPTMPMAAMAPVAMPTPLASPTVKRRRTLEQLSAVDAPPFRRRDVAIAAGIALLVIAIVIALGWERAPGPLPPIAVQPLVSAAAASEPARAPEPKFEATPESVQGHRALFEKQNSEESIKTKARARTLVRTRPQVAEYAGKDRFGELQVIVLYNGREVAIDVGVDGIVRGTSPIFLPVKPGAHAITIDRYPLEAVRVPVTVPDHKSVRMEIELVPLE